MLPMIAKVAIVGGLGFVGYKLVKGQPIFQKMTTTAPNGMPVTVATPVSQSVTSAQATGTATTSTKGAPPTQSVSVPGQGTAYAPAGSIVTKGQDILQNASIVLAPTGATSTAIASIKDVQRALNTLGYTPTIMEDGTLSAATVANIKAFQSKMGMVVDGGAGPSVKTALSQALTAMAGGASVAGATVQNSDPASGVATTPSGQTVNTAPALAMSNTNVQQALNQAGANPPLQPDGIFGPKTVAAIKSFQVANGMVPDGVAGPKLKTALALSTSVMGAPLPAGIPSGGDPAAVATTATTAMNTASDIASAISNLGG